MKSRRLLVNLLAFFVLSAALIVYGMLDLLGNPLAHKTTVSTVFPNASGSVRQLLGGARRRGRGHRDPGVALAQGGATVAMAIDQG